MLKVLTLNTDAEELKEITGEVEAFVKESGVREGLCLVYCPIPQLPLPLMKMQTPM